MNPKGSTKAKFATLLVVLGSCAAVSGSLNPDVSFMLRSPCSPTGRGTAGTSSLGRSRPTVDLRIPAAMLLYRMESLQARFAARIGRHMSVPQTGLIIPAQPRFRVPSTGVNGMPSDDFSQMVSDLRLFLVILKTLEDVEVELRCRLYRSDTLEVLVRENQTYLLNLLCGFKVERLQSARAFGNDLRQDRQCLGQIQANLQPSVSEAASYYILADLFLRNSTSYIRQLSTML